MERELGSNNTQDRLSGNGYKISHIATGFGGFASGSLVMLGTIENSIDSNQGFLHFIAGGLIGLAALLNSAYSGHMADKVEAERNELRNIQTSAQAPKK